MTTVTLNFPEEVLDKAGLDEQQLKIELACRLFAQHKLELWPAAQLAGLTRQEMEASLMDRHIPVYYIDEAYWKQEQAALETMRRQWPSS